MNLETVWLLASVLESYIKSQPLPNKKRNSIELKHLFEHRNGIGYISHDEFLAAAGHAGFLTTKINGTKAVRLDMQESSIRDYAAEFPRCVG